KKISENATFCTECGNPTSPKVAIKTSPNSNLDQKWWLRFAKVIYIALYIPLPFLLILVWDEKSRYYGSTGEAFWLALLTFVIYVVVVRLIKITFLYIVFAQKPQWKKEFKKFF
ncbi:MAG: hypothetical protein AAB876_00535, partial [Patescibacteria group bacterium]